MSSNKRFHPLSKSFSPPTITPLDRSLFSSSFEEIFDHFFNDFFGDKNRFRDITKNKTEYPKTDIFISEDGKNYIFQMAVPGLPKEKISVEIDANERTLTVKTTEDYSNTSKEIDKFYVKELRHSSFQRSWFLGDEMDLEQSVSSSLKDGILEIKVPIKEVVAKEAKSTKVKVEIE
jgi:HSP20 family protein